MQRFAAALVSGTGHSFSPPPPHRSLPTGCPVTVFPVTPLQRFVADRHAAARGAKPNVRLSRLFTTFNRCIYTTQPRLVDLTAADLVAALVDIDDDETRRKAKALGTRS